MIQSVLLSKIYALQNKLFPHYRNCAHFYRIGRFIFVYRRAKPDVQAYKTNESKCFVSLCYY